MADTINIYTFTNTTNKNMCEFLYNSYIIYIKDSHAYFDRIMIQDGFKMCNDIKTSTVVDINKDDNKSLRIKTRNSVYEFEFEGSITKSELEALSNAYSHLNGGGHRECGNPYTLQDKGYVYDFGDYTLEFRYLAHPDINGKDVYYDVPENVWITKDGKNVWSVDSPTMCDILKLIRLALSHTISTDTLYNLEQSGVYVYESDAYLDRK